VLWLSLYVSYSSGKGEAGKIHIYDEESCVIGIIIITKILGNMIFFWPYYEITHSNHVESLKISPPREIRIGLMDSHPFPRQMTIEELKTRKPLSNRVSALTPATIRFFEGS
jgi:hypothetical protein